jgi:predicted deacetylase
MATRPERLLLASVHDVCPRFEREVDRLLDLLHPHVGACIALLVVPNHWCDSPIVPSSPFARRLRRWADEGMEIFLHGYFHRDTTQHRRAATRLRARIMTAGEGEFLGLSRLQAEDRILRGRDLLEQVTGRPIAGFVAPAWLYGPGAKAALAHCSVALAEDHLRIWSPKMGRQLARGPVITWASRTPLRLASSLAAAAVLRQAPVDILRIGVHPPDCHHEPIVRSIEKTLGKAASGRRPGRYSDLLARSA